MFHTLCLMAKRVAFGFSCLFMAGLFLSSETVRAQTNLIAIESSNKPLSSLFNAAEAARAISPVLNGGLLHVPNFLVNSRTQVGGFQGPDAVLQDFSGPNLANVVGGFEGSDNDDNASLVGSLVTPPDTNGEVGPNHFVQMINLITTVFDKNGAVLGPGPFPSNAFWYEAGGLCEAFNQGDPVVLYDETNDRWLVSQIAFDNNFTAFSQCIAVSQTGDPLGEYNRYEFFFDDVGLPDYPKHGIVTASITMTANLFAPPPLSFFLGTFLGAIDKEAMYSGATANMIFAALACFINCEVGFLPADLDDPSGTASFFPAIFATAMSRNRRIDIWQLTVNWGQENPLEGATIGRVADVRISAFDSDLCGAPREACIPQPSGAPQLEAITDRLMHRLQVRDSGRHKTMMVAHTVDGDGNGTAGIRWYELRMNERNGHWSLRQEGTYAPADGLSRWMPSIAMNAAGDIGLGFLVSSTDMPMEIRTTGQTAASNGTGIMDGGEQTCRPGVSAQFGAARSGDYSSTSVDPVRDTFWHTNEYGQHDGWAGWGTYVCEFEVIAAACASTEDPEVSCSDSVDNDCDGLIDDSDPDCQGGFCAQVDDSCVKDSDCCSANCSNGRPSTRVCLP